MGEGYNFEKFRASILAGSVSKDWDTAKAEWHLHMVYEDPGERSCICDHAPIHQICRIKNEKNGNLSEVGNVCVQKFLRLMSNRIFSVIRRVRDDVTRSLNPKALELFADRGVITDDERCEYEAYWRKRTNMTDAQRTQKRQINQRVLAYVASETPKLIARAQGMMDK